MAETAQITQLVDHLFRHEAGKLVSVLTHIFGTQNIDLAEDVVQDSMIEALDLWQYKGVPDNPSAWLFKVAKNKALNIVNREKTKRKYQTDSIHLLKSEWTAEPVLNHFFSDLQIQDDQLRMIFMCCHPSISTDSQVALALRTLCGFSISEIARAFVTTEENINKRLVRARKKIRDDKILFEVPQGNELEKRMQAVLETIYLLFNEGYSASNGNDIIRYELCGEAIRLAQIIATSKSIAREGNVFALLSLMYLNASRFKARHDANGNLLTMAEQDRSLWDREMISAGLEYLNEASINDHQISVYHILAAISAHHSLARDFKSTNWKNILSLYDQLFQIDRSPIILLNRAIAVLKVEGPEMAIAEIEKIEKAQSLQSYHLLYSTKAEFLMESNQYAKAAVCLEKAIQLASLQAEKDLLGKKLVFCRKKIF